jgi:hypothetical protein
MSLLCQFLQQRFESSISSIVDDNAKSPSDCFRDYIHLHHPCYSSPQSQPTLRTTRAVNRYHSEPLHVCITETGVSRWAATKEPVAVEKDQMLRMPRRVVDRWSVSRNQSDSALLVAERRSSLCTSLHRLLESPSKQAPAQDNAAEGKAFTNVVDESSIVDTFHLSTKDRCLQTLVNPRDELWGSRRQNKKVSAPSTGAPTKLTSDEYIAVVDHLRHGSSFCSPTQCRMQRRPAQFSTGVSRIVIA